MVKISAPWKKDNTILINQSYSKSFSLFVFFVQIIIPKQKGEILGIVIVESGWGSMLPTVVIANMTPQGPAARCGQINIGDQIIGN